MGMRNIILWVLFVGIPTAFNILRTLGDIDFVIERSKNPSWLKTVYEYILKYFIGETPLYIHIIAFIVIGLLVFPKYTVSRIIGKFKQKPDTSSTIKTKVQEDGNPLVVSQDLSVSRDIARSKSDPEIVLFAFDKPDFSVVPLSQKWADWISYEKGEKGLVATVNRPSLDYNDFGNEFYFVDLSNDKIISIPIGKLAKHLDVGSSFHKGMVLYLKSKDL